MEIFNYTFLSPSFFVLIIIVPIFIFLFYNKQKYSINFIFLNDLKKVFKHNDYLFYLKIFIVSSIIISFSILLANPNISNTEEKITKKWIDIVLALDVSISMEETDFSPNRLESAKNTLLDFIDIQQTNRLWLVVFAWKPFTSIPLTFDYSILKDSISRTTTNTIDQYYNYQELAGTALWDAILMSSTLFLDDSREKIIILITDWDENDWVLVDYKTASLLAKEKNIKIYTIWIGDEKGRIIDYMGQQITINALNSKILSEISSITSWENYIANNNYSLQNIFEKLEKLEKKEIEIEQKKDYKTAYEKIVFIILILMFIYILISFRKKEL